MFNFVFTGNLGTDPRTGKYQSANGEQTWASLNLAVADGKDKDGNPRTEWVSVSVFGPMADNVAKYLKKGCKVTVSGSQVPKVRTYTTKDGKLGNTIQFRANTVDWTSQKQAVAMAAPEVPEVPDAPVYADGLPW